MIPVRAKRNASGDPYAVWAIALACTAVLVRLALLPDERAAAIVRALGVTPALLLASPWSPEQLVTLLSSTFLHAGWFHLAANVLYLIVFGPAVFDRLGARWFVLLYLLAGAVGALTHSLADPLSMAPLVGASGAIAGVLGAHLVLEPRAKVTTLVPVLFFFEVASLPAAFVIGLWFVLQLASAFAPVAAVSSSESIAWYAHLGGFAVGIVLATTLSLGKRAPRSKRRPVGRRIVRSRGKRAA